MRALCGKTSQYSTAADIPQSVIDNHPLLYGYVERVIDGDTIRVTQISDLREVPKPKTGSVQNSTIIVRLYGVDAPETAKKESESSQPFGEDAKQLTKDLTYHKTIAWRPLNRDKYNRIIAEVDALAGAPTGTVVHVSRSLIGSKDLSQELASRGLATMYTGKGAEYDVSRVP